MKLFNRLEKEIYVRWNTDLRENEVNNHSFSVRHYKTIPYSGYIRVYSEVGSGTTFKIYLPRVDESIQKHSQSMKADDLLQGTETILLTEDEEVVRKLTYQILEMYGYKVLVAANGAEALSICEQYTEPIDMLITDVIIPEINGRELADKLCKLRPEMQVLFMSGYTDNAILHQQVLNEGASFLQKPFNPDSLAVKVKEILYVPTEENL